MKDENPVYLLVHIIPRKHPQIVLEEIRKMLEAGIITCVTSSWVFPVVIATKKDRKPIFCIYYRLLDQSMKPNRCHIKKIQESFDYFAGRIMFKVLDLFSGY